MGSFFESIWIRAGAMPGATWDWFNALNREEWIVVLTVVCVCGFASLLGFNSQRL